MDNAVATRVWRNQFNEGSRGTDVPSDDHRTLCLYFELRYMCGKDEVVGLTCTGTSTDGTWEIGDLCFTGSPSKPTQVGQCIHVHNDDMCSWILIRLSDQFNKSFAGNGKILVSTDGKKMPTGNSIAILTTSDQVSYGGVGDEYGFDWLQITCPDGSRFSKNDNGSFVWTTSTDPELPACGVIGYHSQQKPMVKTLHSLLSGLNRDFSKMNQLIGRPFIFLRPRPGTFQLCQNAVRSPEDEYKNDSEPRGRALIISIERFSTSSHLENRVGGHLDVDALRAMLRDLQYEVDVIKNLEANEIMEELIQESRRDHENYDSFMLFLLSHGVKGALYGNDGVCLAYDQIINTLNNKDCPSLRGKPKMIFIQACQGTTADPGASPEVEVVAKTFKEAAIPTIYSDTNVPDGPIGSPGQQNDPTMADFLVMQATTPDYVSWRNIEKGSWFIQALVEIFQRDAHKDDVISMLLRVIDEVSMKQTRSGNKQAPSIYFLTLRKKVFFFPAPAPPEGVNFELTEDANVCVTWKHPPTGRYDGYVVRCFTYDTGEMVKEKTPNVEKVIFHDLVPGAKYKFRIQSCSHGQTSQPREEYYQIRPGKPEVLKQATFETNAVPLEWRHAKGCTACYIVHYVEQGKQDQQSQEIYDHKVTLPELTPGSRYTGTITPRVFDNGCPIDGIPENWTAITDPLATSKCDIEYTSTRSVRILWTLPPCPVDYFEIAYHPRDKLSATTTKKRLETWVLLESLEPGIQYQMQITSISNGRKSEPFQKWFQTGPDMPAEFVATERGTTYVDIKWEKPRGSLDYFIVTWQNEDQVEDVQSIETTKTHYRVPELVPGTTFKISVLTVSSKKKSMTCSLEAQTIPAMINKDTIEMTEGVGSYTLKWKPPVGKVDGYDISVKQDGSNTYERKISSTQPDVSIGKVISGTMYVVEIRSCSHEKQSEPCTIQFRKSPAPPLLQTNKLFVTKEAIALYWDPPPGEFSEYEIFHQKGNGEDGNGTIRHLHAGNTYVIRDLQPSTHYTGWVRTLTECGLGSEHAQFELFTDPEPPHMFSPINDKRQSTSLTFKWKASRGDIKGYLLIVCDTEGKEILYELGRDTTTFDIYGLTPGMIYRCRICSVSAREKKSDFEEYESRTVPECPRSSSITIQNQGGTYTVRWERPGGVFKQMLFEYYPQGNEKDRKSLTTKDNPSPQLTVTPGTIYVLQAFSLTDHDRSDPCELKFTTAPLMPQLWPEVIATNSVFISWESVQPACSYEVSCEQSGTEIIPAIVTSGCELILEELLPATKYVIKIQTCVTDHKNEILKSAVQESTLWTKPSSPKEFKQTNSRKDKKREPTSAKLRWNAPDEDIDQFEVTYDAHGVGRQLGKVVCSRRSAKISGLEPGTKYSCSISAVLRNGQRSDVVKCVAFTAPATPSNILSIAPNTNGIYLKWMPAAGDVQKYSIQYRSIQGIDTDNQEGPKNGTSLKALLAQDGDSDESHSDEESVDPDEENPQDKIYDKIESIRSQCNIEKLEAGTMYEILIFAIAHSYPAPPLRVIQATKPGKPGEVSKIESHSIVAGPISLSWVPSDGHVNGYEIEYGREDRSTRQHLTSDSPKCIIDNITPGVQYSYVVYAISNGMRGDPSQFVAATDLPSPVNFEVNTASTRSLHLKWNSPPSFADGSWSYTVKYRQYGCTDGYQNERQVKTGNLEVTGLVPGRRYEFSVQITGWKDAVGHSTSKEIFCTGTTEPESVHNLRFDSSKDTLYWDKPDGDIEGYGIEEKVGAKIGVFVSKACQHHLQNIKRGEQYTFIVVAISNGKRSKEVSHSETIAPGRAKFRKEITTVTTSAINLEWDAPGGTVNYYEICYQPVDEDVGFLSSWWSEGERRETTDHCQHTLKNLQPGMKYRCTVFAIVDGARDKHGDTMLVATKPEKPTVESDLSTETLILKCTCKGRKDCFEIRYKFQDDREWKTEFFQSSPRYETEKVELLKWQKGRIYEVEVKSISYHGTDFEVKSDPVRMKIHTEPPKPVVRYSVTTTELQVEWNQITEVAVNTIAIVYWQGIDQQQRKKREISNIASTSCSIDKLTPGTLYHTEVSFYCGDKSSSSGKIGFRTDPVPPSQIYETNVSHSTATIEWDLPKGQFDGIIVLLIKLSTNESTDLPVRHGSHDIKLTSLTPATQYRVTVWSKSGEKRSKPQYFDFCTAPLSPQNLCANATARSASISWTYPNKHSQDNINFEMKYWEQTSRLLQFKTGFSEVTEKTIESLKPGSSYKVQVWSVFNGRKSEDYCEGVIDTDPLPVNDFHVEAHLTYADVAWIPPSGGRVKRYDIEYAPVGNPRNKRKISVQHPTFKGSIINLNPGTKYSVKVVSVVEGRESQSEDKKYFYTVPSPPSMIPPEITSDSVKVKWSRNEQEPDVTEAIVTYKRTDYLELQTHHVSAADPQELLIPNLKPLMRLEGCVVLVCRDETRKCDDKTSTKATWSATAGIIL